MAATGMVLAGQAAEAITTTTPWLKAQGDGIGRGHASAVALRVYW
jgi:hypothetical protein